MGDSEQEFLKEMSYAIKISQSHTRSGYTIYLLDILLIVLDLKYPSVVYYLSVKLDHSILTYGIQMAGCFYFTTD